MTLTQINYFLTVAETGSFSAAAERLFVSQPAVSKQIASFEAELGFTLLDRSNHQNFLTPGGKQLYETLLRCLDDLNETVNNIRRSASDGSVFRIGCYDNWEASIIIDLLMKHFEANHPGITLQIEAYSVADITNALLEREIDAAMATMSLFEGNHSLAAYRAGSMALGVAYSKMHYDPVNAEFTLAPLLISDGLPSHEQQNFLRCARSSGYNGEVIHVRSDAMVSIQALRGRGIAVVSEFDIIRRDQHFGFVPFGGMMPLAITSLRKSVSSEISRMCAEIGQLVSDFDATRDTKY